MKPHGTAFIYMLLLLHYNYSYGYYVPGSRYAAVVVEASPTRLYHLAHCCSH